MFNHLGFLAMKTGNLVKWVEGADENSPGWAEDTAGTLGIVIQGCETLGYGRTGELSNQWFWFSFRRLEEGSFIKTSR